VAARILSELQLTDAGSTAVIDGGDEESTASDAEVDRLVDQLSEAELREVLAELEKPGGAQP
jgi:hypothetical protein